MILLVKRLTSQLYKKGVSSPEFEAVKILKQRGHLDFSGNLTEEGRKRQDLGNEGRAKDRAIKRSGDKYSNDDFEYDPLTNRTKLIK